MGAAGSAADEWFYNELEQSGKGGNCMKTRKRSILSGALCLIFLLAGCRSDEAVKKDVEQVEQSETRAQEDMDEAVEKDTEILEQDLAEPADEK